MSFVQTAKQVSLVVRLRDYCTQRSRQPRAQVSMGRRPSTRNDGAAEAVQAEREVAGAGAALPAPEAAAEPTANAPVKRKRGRPPKNPPPGHAEIQDVQHSMAQDRRNDPSKAEAAAVGPADDSSSPQPKRRRGRPPKDPNQAIPSKAQPTSEAPLANDGPSRPKRERRSPAPSCFAAASQDTQNQSQQQAEQKQKGRRKKSQPSGSGSAGLVQHKDYVYRQAVRRVAAQIQRISQEEHLIQSYAADGWKGAR